MNNNIINRAAYRIVRIFISSTFTDMQAERDQLVRFVFPKLREELLSRRIHVVDVDLRWGVTNEQDALSVCCEIIDECQIFLCMLGERYGSVPPGKIRSITAEEVYYGVLDRIERRDNAFFYFRDSNSTAEMVEEKPGEFREPSGSTKEFRLKELKQAIKNAGFKPVIYSAKWEKESRRLIGLKEFGERIYTDLKQSICREFSEQPPEKLGEFAEENAAMEAFINERTQQFMVGSRKPVMDELLAYAIGTSSNEYLCLVGETGSGKSALLARLAQTLQDQASCNQHLALLPISHFVGASTGSTDVRRTLRRLCYELIDGTGITAEVPDDPEELHRAFPEILRQACTQNRIVILLDAINQFDLAKQFDRLRWLPEVLPDNTRLILSSLPGPALEDLRRRRKPPREVLLPTLTPADGEAIILGFLHRYRKTMSDEQRTALLKKTDAGTPLYLLAALEELRTLGIYEEISNHIAQLPPNTEALFGWILKRLEDDEGFRDSSNRKIGRELVPRFISLMGVSRHGLSQRELTELLASDNPEAEPNLPDDEGNIAALMRLLRPYLMRRGELVDFYHDLFRTAVEKVYLQTELQRHKVHDQLASFFRHKADPEMNCNWVGNVRQLTELPFHLALGGQKSELHALFSQLSYLVARVATGHVYELVADYSLAEAPLPGVLMEWYDFLRKHAQRLVQHPAMLVSLIHHEGFAEARAQATTGQWQQPWLRTSPEPMPDAESRDSEDLHAEVTGNYKFHWSRVTAIAPQKAVVFCLEHLGALRVINTNVMQQTDVVLSISQKRPLVLVCAPDASSLTAFYESGKAELYKCVSGRDEWPASLELVVEFRFHLPEFENPVVICHGGAYWFQASPDVLAHISVENPHASEEPLSEGNTSELAALVFGEDKRLIVLRQGRDTLLLADGAEPLRRRDTDVSSACACGKNRFAVAFTDGHIVVYESNSVLTVKFEVRAGLIRGALGWDGSRLLWLSNKCGFQAWQLGENTPMSVQNYQEVFPDHLYVCPRHWFSFLNGTMLLVTTHSIISLKLLQSSAASWNGRFETVFGGQLWRAVFKKDNDQWLLEGQSLRKVILARGVPAHLYCAPDGKDHFFVMAGYRPGLVLDLATFQLTPLQVCSSGVNMVSGDPEGGCWFTDRAGDIYFVDAWGQIQCVERIGLNEVRGAQIKNCGEHLVWYGYSTRHFDEEGPNAARTFVLFRKLRGNTLRLERLGEQYRNPSEGLSLAICYDEYTEQLVNLWHKSSGGIPTYRLRVSSLLDLINWRFKETEVTGLGRECQFFCAFDVERDVG